MPIVATFTTEPETVLRSYRACHPLAVVLRVVLAAALAVLG